jgi:hypothetical protein
MFKSKQRSTIIRSLATASAALAIAAVGAAPAAAWPVDHPKILHPDVKFGSGWDSVLGEPPDGGALHWDPDAATGATRPRLSGRMYVKNSADRRVHMKLEYFDATGTEIPSSSRGSILETPISNQLNTFNLVNFQPFMAANIFGVRVTIVRETAPASNVWVNEASVYESIF